MIEENQQWHYTDSNGQQAGPVTTIELRSLVDAGKASGESMVWSEGMANWTLASQIDGLILAKVPVPSAVAQPVAMEPTPTATNNPYAPPQTNVGSMPTGEFEIPQMGGIGRLTYFLAGLGIAIFQQVIIYIITPATSYASDPEISASSVQTSAMLTLILAIVFFVLQLFLVGYRYKNIGFNPWWALLYIIPIVNIIIGIRCLTCQQGYAYTRKLDRAGRIIAWIIGILIIGGILLVVLSVAFITMN